MAALSPATHKVVLSDTHAGYLSSHIQITQSACVPPEQDVAAAKPIPSRQSRFPCQIQWSPLHPPVPGPPAHRAPARPACNGEKSGASKSGLGSSYQRAPVPCSHRSSLRRTASPSAQCAHTLRAGIAAPSQRGAEGPACGARDTAGSSAGHTDGAGWVASGPPDLCTSFFRPARATGASRQPCVPARKQASRRSLMAAYQ